MRNFVYLVEKGGNRTDSLGILYSFVKELYNRLLVLRALLFAFHFEKKIPQISLRQEDSNKNSESLELF